ncbi:MAG: hypothetical protein D6773_16310 [Alphaproteobacteria bacterium]|nr:MAG: hypothetical protein D6773_16310 [Alphaproteobacteria bacterium]
MPIIDIEGVGRVEVEDAFNNLTPEEQQAEVEAIAADIRAGRSEGGGVPETAQAPGAIPEGGGDTVLASAVPDSGASLTDVARSFLGQGVGLAGGDELEALVRSLVGPESFDEELANVRAGLKDFQERNPGLALTTEIIGALVPAFLSRGRTAPRSAAQLALRGAGVGGVLGFNQGEGVEDRLERAAFGAGGGAVASGIASGVIGAARKGADIVRGVVAPERQAAKRVAEAEARGAALKDGLDEAEFRAAQAAGQPATNIERIGEPARALARASGNVSDEARIVLNKAINERFEGQAGRIAEKLETLVERPVKIGGKVIRPTETQTITDVLKDQAAKLNAPAFRAAFRAGDRPLRSPEIERLMSAPAVMQAIKRAVTSGKNRAVRDGFGAFNPPVVIDEAGNVTFKTSANGQRIFPNLQFWDSVKRELDSVAGRAFRLGDKESGAVAAGLAKDLREELDRLVPAYKKTRSQAAQFFDAEDAVNAGRNFVKSAKDIKTAKAALNKMNPAERELFAQGFTEQLVNDIMRAPVRVNVVRSVFSSPQARRKLQVALGPKRAREVEAFLNVEALMDLARTAVQGNSTTARQLIEGFSLGFGGAAFATGDFTSPVTIFSGLAGAAGRMRIGRAEAQVARRVAEMLTSSNPDVYRRGVAMVANSPKLLGNFRKSLAAVAESAAVPAGAETATALLP